MAQPVIQTSFNAGEWAPALNARVDLGKYHSGAALLRNFFVDYRGGASSRSGTKYILQAYRSSTAVRLISFQASFTVSYVMEFGNNYIRFYSNGAPVLETAKSIPGITNAAAGVFGPFPAGHGFNIGDWVFVNSAAGMTQVNGKYYIISSNNFNALQFTVTDLFGVTVNTTTYGVYTGSGTVARVYTLPSPYTSTDLAGLKFAGNINTMVFCHPSFPPYLLTLIAANNWTLTRIVFGTTVTTPTGLAIASIAPGVMNYSYVVSAVDANDQESAVSAVTASTVTNAVGNQNINFSWGAVSSAVSYNVYRAGPSTVSVVPTGASFGFVANVTGTAHNDSFVTGIPVFPADFSLSIPIPKNPFQGAGVASATVTAPGAYAGVVPTVTFAAAPTGGFTATGTATAQIQGTPAIVNGAVGNQVGDILDGQFTTCSVVVASVGGGGVITALQPITFPGSVPGSIASGNSVPANPVTFINRRNPAIFPTANLVWGIGAIAMISHGAGYTSVPAITFSSGAATATAVLETASTGNPTVPIYLDQRLALMGPRNNPHQFNLSQPGSYFNYNVSFPVQPDDAIQGTLVANKLNSIQSGIVMSAGLIILTDLQAWLFNGGSAGSPPTAIDAAANSQAYNGSSALPPIVANLDILYVQAKGSIVRDLTFNFYTNIYTGADISVLSSHLFYGFTLTEWAYAEEPFKTVWCVRNDGDLLSLTFVKEQELIGWAHSDTQGLFKSIASVTETVTLSNGLAIAVDAVYTVVQRIINGSTVQYIERMAERVFPYGVEDAWCVDAGLITSPVSGFDFSGTLSVSSAALGSATATLIGGAFSFSAGNVGQILRVGGGIMTITGALSGTQVSVNITQEITNVFPDGSPIPAVGGTWRLWINNTSFQGGEHLAGQTVTGLADGAVITPFVMPTNGSFTLPTAASKVVVGMAFTPQLKTLALDLGQPTVQGKRKKIVNVAARCQDTLGLSIGKTFDTSSQVPMKDLIVGNLGSQTNEVVTNAMVTGDAMTVIDQSWDVPGQYCIQQNNPFPASILGVIPEVTVGDS